MTDSTLDAQKRKEAQARYDNINRRIEGVDRDISTETDGERLATLREKRNDLAAQRDAANSELMALDKRGNGDLHLLQQKVNELGRVLVSDRPEDAHAIINECAAALARMDARVMGLEGRVAAIDIASTHPWSSRCGGRLPCWCCSLAARCSGSRNRDRSYSGCIRGPGPRWRWC